MKSDSPLHTSLDQITADGFALSWNNKPPVYSMEQFTDWLEPLDGEDFENKSVLELGCGNRSLLFHLNNWAPSHVIGVDLGDGVIQARKNLSAFPTIQILQGDLVTFTSKRFDTVLCIGVLHHLENPKHGLDSVVRNTTPEAGSTAGSTATRVTSWPGELWNHCAKFAGIYHGGLQTLLL